VPVLFLAERIIMQLPWSCGHDEEHMKRRVAIVIGLAVVGVASFAFFASLRTNWFSELISLTLATYGAAPLSGWPG
jgi:hypothetical protein